MGASISRWRPPLPRIPRPVDLTPRNELIYSAAAPDHAPDASPLIAASLHSSVGEKCAHRFASDASELLKRPIAPIQPVEDFYRPPPGG